MDLNIVDHGSFLCCGKFAGYCPTRTSGYGAQPLLDRDIVYLDHDAVDFVGQLRHDLIDVVIVGDTLMDIFGLFDMVVNLEAPFVKGLQDIPVSLECFSRYLADTVTEYLQGSSRGYP